MPRHFIDADAIFFDATLFLMPLLIMRIDYYADADMPFSLFSCYYADYYFLSLLFHYFFAITLITTLIRDIDFHARAIFFHYFRYWLFYYFTLLSYITLPQRAAEKMMMMMIGCRGIPEESIFLSKI
jgi:hypothetical protein